MFLLNFYFLQFFNWSLIFLRLPQTRLKYTYFYIDFWVFFFEGVFLSLFLNYNFLFYKHDKTAISCHWENLTYHNSDISWSPEQHHCWTSWSWPPRVLRHNLLLDYLSEHTFIEQHPSTTISSASFSPWSALLEVVFSKCFPSFIFKYQCLCTPNSMVACSSF